MTRVSIAPARTDCVTSAAVIATISAINSLAVLVDIISFARDALSQTVFEENVNSNNSNPNNAKVC